MGFLRWNKSSIATLFVIILVLHTVAGFSSGPTRAILAPKKYPKSNKQRLFVAKSSSDEYMRLGLGLNEGTKRSELEAVLHERNQNMNRNGRHFVPQGPPLPLHPKMHPIPHPRSHFTPNSDPNLFRGNQFSNPRPRAMQFHPLAAPTTLPLLPTPNNYDRRVVKPVQGRAGDNSSEVIDIIVKQLGVDVSEVQPSSDIVNDLGGDSMDEVELVMALEEKFSIDIPDEDAEALHTVQDYINYINDHIHI